MSVSSTSAAMNAKATSSNQPATQPAAPGGAAAAAGSAATADTTSNTAATDAEASLQPTTEQLRYANFLEKGMRVGLACLFITFPLYVCGIIKPYTPLEKIPHYLTLNAHTYQEEAHIETGWSWLRLLEYGDYLNFVGITILAGVTVLCYLSIIPFLFKRKDTVYLVLAVLQVALLVLAASGVVASGGH